MQLKSFSSFAGFVILLAATYCPLLRPFGLFSWNLYDLNKPYGMVVLLVAVVGIAAVVLRQRAIGRMAAWVAFTLVALVFVAAVLKVYHAFSFIPFKTLAGYLTRHIRFKWGWFVLFAGPLLALIGTWGAKKTNFPEQSAAQQK